jgi:hypothetical protein
VEAVLGDLAPWVMPLTQRDDTSVLLTRHRDPQAPCRVYFADTREGTLATGACGPTQPDLVTCDDTITLVCTHGRRDRCCAVLGRPLLDVVADGRESSHIGGHRFAPSVLLLPSGIVLGRTTAEVWPRVIALGPDTLPYYRGRTGLAAPAQVADAEARRVWKLGLMESLSVVRDTSVAHMRFHVGHANAHLVIDVESTARPYVPSCGKEPDSTTVWRVTGRS